MVKRKVSTNGDVSGKANKKAKKVSESVEEEDNASKLELKNPDKTFLSLIKPTSSDEFFSNVWEKKHLHIKRDDKDYYGSLFTMDIFKKILQEEELEFESDVNVCRYTGEEKELLNEEGRITVKKMQKLFDDKNATFQIHQPQRYSDILWNLMEKLETYFGCLFGSNVYITPSNSQGLAPHCDDVEIFVMQLEGKKHWKLYKPMVELSRDYTQDLQESDIGEPIFEVTLEPGDMLYFPRGTIHQAKTVGDTYSTHISMSTYQQNTWGDFLQHAVSQAIDNALEDDVSLRSGLPINYLKFLGTAKNMGKYVETVENGDSKTPNLPLNEKDKKVIEFKENIKKYLSKLIDHIDVNTAADAMSSDFMASRLPPHGHVVTIDEESDRKVPTLDDKIKVRYPDHVRITYSEEEEETQDISQLEDDSEMEEDENEEEEKPKKNKKKGSVGDEKPASGNKKEKKKSTTSDGETEEDEDDEDVTDLEEEEPCIRVIHSLSNERETHMCGEVMNTMAGGILKLPVHFAAAAIALLNSTDFVAVKDLLLEDDNDKLTLATTFFADGLIEIQE